MHLPNADDIIPVLSKRQMQVLELMAHGFTNTEIADIVQMSRRSIENIRKSIVELFQANNSTEAVSKAIFKGVLLYDPERFSALKTMRDNSSE
jgi:DNA-binding NarL/FixJ family response regulator